jgi:hypothetical protein
VCLPEETPEALQAFLTFLDTGVVHLDHFRRANEEGTDQEALDEDAKWDNLAEAWLLGDRILSSSFKDATVDKVTSLANEHGTVPASMHREIYRGSAYKSGMRALLVDMAVHSWFPGTLADQPGEPESAEFFRDVGCWPWSV